VVCYLAGLLLIGTVASRRMKDVKDYFAGGKRIGYRAVAFSARATGESAWLLLGGSCPPPSSSPASWGSP